MACPLAQLVMVLMLSSGIRFSALRQISLHCLTKLSSFGSRVSSSIELVFALLKILSRISVQCLAPCVLVEDEFGRRRVEGRAGDKLTHEQEDGLVEDELDDEWN